MAGRQKFSFALRAIKDKIVRVRRKDVMLDHHVAELYEVPTREVNRAVKNPSRKVP